MSWISTLLLIIELARVLAGETPGCPVEAKIAAAHVAANRIEAGIEGGWFGDADPEQVDIAVSVYWNRFPDPTDGALYFIGPGDAVKMPWLQERTTKRYQCDGTWVEAWK